MTPLHNNTMVIHVYIQYKFQEISFIGYLVIAEDGKFIECRQLKGNDDREKSLQFRQSKGDNSSITHDTLMELHMHNHTMVICIQYKVHEFHSLVT